MAGLRTLGAAVLAACLIAGCTTGSAHVAGLTPSIPGSGIQFCAQYELNATTAAGTIPLVNCAGVVGVHPTPALAVHVGDEVTVSGLHGREFVTSGPHGFLEAHDTTFVAIRPGNALVTVHGYPCVAGPTGIQRRACSLLQLRIT